MAQTFQKIFGDKLVKQDTDEQDGTLLKLPSPEELKEKIILKGRRRSPDERRPSDERGGGFAQRVCPKISLSLSYFNLLLFVRVCMRVHSCVCTYLQVHCLSTLTHMHTCVHM